MHFIRAALALVLVGVVACDDHEFKSESVAVSGEGLEAVKQVMEDSINTENVELCIVPTATGKLEYRDTAHISALLNGLN